MRYISFVRLHSSRKSARYRLAFSKSSLASLTRSGAVVGVRSLRVIRIIWLGKRGENNPEATERAAQLDKVATRARQTIEWSRALLLREPSDYTIKRDGSSFYFQVRYLNSGFWFRQSHLPLSSKSKGSHPITRKRLISQRVRPFCALALKTTFLLADALMRVYMGDWRKESAFYPTTSDCISFWISLLKMFIHRSSGKKWLKNQLALNFVRTRKKNWK